MKLNHFKDKDFLPAIKAVFKKLNVHELCGGRTYHCKEILKDTYKDNGTFQLVDDVYFVGMVDDEASTRGISATQIAKRYEISLPSAWYFMNKVCRGMESSGIFPTKEKIHVHDLLVEGFRVRNFGFGIPNS